MGPQVKPFLGFCLSYRRFHVYSSFVNPVKGKFQVHMKSTIARGFSFPNRIFLLGLWDVLKIGFRRKKMSHIKKAYFSLNYPNIYKLNRISAHSINNHDHFTRTLYISKLYVRATSCSGASAVKVHKRRSFVCFFIAAKVLLFITK